MLACSRRFFAEHRTINVDVELVREFTSFGGKNSKMFFFKQGLNMKSDKAAK